MKRIVLGIVVALGALLLIAAGIAEAVHTPGEGRIGEARVNVNAGLLSSNWFACITVENTAATQCPVPNTNTILDIDAGQCVDLRYWIDSSGPTPGPIQPNLASVQVYKDDTSTLVISYLSAGAVPAAGTLYSFCATNNGLVGGTPTAGPYRLYTRLLKNNDGTGVNNYDINSDVGLVSSGSAITGHTFDTGVVRASMTADSITASTPPAGSFFAYTGTEAVTITLDGTDNHGTGTRTTRVDIMDGTDVQTTGTSQTPSAAGVVVRTETIDDSLDLVQKAYGVDWIITGKSTLTDDFAVDVEWTRWADTGHGTDITRISDTVVRKADVFTADPTVRIDTHPQRDTTLIKDNFPTEDATEDLAYIIGEDVISIWAHVVNARTEDLDTAAGSVVVSIRNPSDVEQDSLTTQTGADGWTPASLDFGVAAPSGLWTARAIFAVTGASAQDDEPVTFQSPFSANKQIRLFFATDLVVGVNHTFIARIELDDMAFTPDTTPMIRISRYVIDDTGLGQFLQYEDVVTWRNMTNSFDFTETPVGATYFFNWTVADAGVYGVSVRSNITGTLIRQHEPVDAADVGVFSVLGAGFIGLSDEATFTILAWGLVLGLAWWQRFYVLAFWVSLTLIATLIPSDPIPTSVGLIMAVIIAWVHILTRWGTSLMQPRERTT